MYKDETKSSALALQLSAYDYVVLDTCSLMEDSFPVWLDTLSASKEYWKEGLEVLIPKKCLEELTKHTRDRNKENIAKKIAAKRAKKIVKHVIRRKVISVYKGNKDDIFADNVIYNFANRYRLDKKVLIVTQDKKLASDLRKLNQLESQHGRYLDVYRIGNRGDLIPNYGEQLNSTHSEKPYNNRENKPGLSPRFPRRPYEPGKPSHFENKEETPEQKIIRDDRRLSSNLDNPNYPVRKKIADIEAQVSAINALPKDVADKLSLAFTVPELEERLKGLGETAPAEPKKEVPAEPKKERPAPKKSEPKPAEPTGDKPKGPKVDHSKALGSGKSLEEAIRLYCRAKSVIVRDDSVPYFAAVHGPYDVTESVIKAFVSEAGDVGELYKGSVAGLGVVVRHSGKFYDAYDPKNDGSVVEEHTLVVKTEESLQKPVKVADNATEKKPAKAASKTSKKSNRDTVTATSEAVVPNGANLIVGIPDDEKTERRIRKKINQEEAKEATPIEKLPNQPAVKKTSKAAPKKEADKPVKKEPAKATKKPAEKPAKKEEPAKAGNPKLEEAIKNDRRLQANLNNPNFPKASAIRDIEAQLTLLRSIPAKDRTGLKYGLRELKSKETELKKEGE